MQGVSNDERRMTIVQHLEELRRVLIWVMAAWIVGTVVAFIFNGFRSSGLTFQSPTKVSMTSRSWFVFARAARYLSFEPNLPPSIR